MPAIKPCRTDETALFSMSDKRPNVLFLMCDQLRADALGGYGNTMACTPNLDRFFNEGTVFDQAYSPCPVCMPARYSVRSGREPTATGNWENEPLDRPGLRSRVGPFLAERMSELGYRSFGVGKYHSFSADGELGYETLERSEDIPKAGGHGDAYWDWLRSEHPAYGHIEMVHGERTEMYYQPQCSPLPKELKQGYWAAERCIEHTQADDERPFFGFVSFLSPHPPLCPPVPFNRMFDPDKLPSPRRGDPEVDAADEQLAWMNHAVWAECISDSQARILRSRYYGEVAYVDWCIGRVLRQLETAGLAESTVVGVFADHGDHLGDHGAWQKESFFESSVKVPFAVRWPGEFQAGARSDALVSLVDLFGVATGAAGRFEARDGVDLRGGETGEAQRRDALFSVYGQPGSRQFKIMCRSGDLKYVFLANGGRELLFDLSRDPEETENLAGASPQRAELRRRCVDHLSRSPLASQSLEGGDLRAMTHEKRPLIRVHQGCPPMGYNGFPKDPRELLARIEADAALVD